MPSTFRQRLKATRARICTLAAVAGLAQAVQAQPAGIAPEAQRLLKASTGSRPPRRRMLRDALARRTMPLAQDDATLFKSLMDGEHSLRGFTHRDIRSQLTKTRWLRSCADDPKKASARVRRCFWRLPAHGLTAKIPRTRRWRVTAYRHQAMGTSLYLREHPFPNVYATAAAT